MRRLLVAVFAVAGLCGCAEMPIWNAPAAPQYASENPMLVSATNYDALWESVVDVVGDYFRIDREEPVRLLGSTLTEGRIDTFPKPGATVFEPWEGDSANSDAHLECTLQTIRRRAVVRVVPAGNNAFWIDVAIFKELENLPTPEHATAGAATFSYDTTLNRVVNPRRPNVQPQGWIPMGRDGALEQRILSQLQFRLSPQGAPLAL
jgi:hypothetical protein